MIRRSNTSQRVPGQTYTQKQVLAAPTSGWNTKDPIANMAPNFAIEMVNYFPETSRVKSRKGCANHVTGFGSRVKSLFSYSPTVDANKKLFAATDSGIFDATTAGAVGAAVSALTNGYCQSLNFKTAAGSYLQVVNGTDFMRLYDGTTWTTITGASTPAITGLATTELIHLNAFKRRIWYVQKNSLSAWYLPIDSIAGALTEFTFGQYCTRGGHLVALATWSIDGGIGVDDFMVAITSEGELLVFQGTDPASATTFALQGVYYIGPPLGSRCFVKMGGDLLYLSDRGIYPLSQALQSSDFGSIISLSGTIDSAFVAAADAYGSTQGWEVQLFPKGNFLLVNVPVKEGARNDQYVMNTVNKSWCSFQGWNASCFIVHNRELYYGSETAVVKAWTGNNDLGSNITSHCYQAFTYIGGSPDLKHVKLIQPVLSATALFDLKAGVNTDYRILAPEPNLSYGTGAVAVWDSSVWDSALWADESTIFDDYLHDPSGSGYVHSVTMVTRSNLAQIEWTATALFFEVGAGR